MMTMLSWPWGFLLHFLQNQIQIHMATRSRGDLGSTANNRTEQNPRA